MSGKGRVQVEQRRGSVKEALHVTLDHLQCVHEETKHLILAPVQLNE